MSSENSELDSHSYSYYSDSSDYYSTSSMSTPSRRSISDAVPTVSGMKDELKRDVDERFVDDKLDVKDFVRHVWGVDQGVIDTILNAAEDFKSTLLDDLIDGYKNAASDREQKAYTPFSDLADYLSGRLQAILPRLVFVNRLYSRRGELVINSGENKRKPDTIIVPKEYQGKYDWKHVLVPFEFKTRDKPARQQTSRLSTPSIAPPSGLSKVLFPPGNGEDSQPFDGGLPLFPPALPHSKPIHANAVPSDGLPGSSRMSPTAGNAADKGDVTATTHAPDQSIPRVSKAQVDKKPKATKGYSSVDSQRKAITVTSSTGRSKKIDINQQPLKSVDSGLSSRASGNKRQANDLPAPPSPKRKKSGPRATGEHLQLARYALECMATASRHYVAGVFIHRFNISLWYYDRAIVARTVDFDFETQPEMLALVLYGLFTCDSRHAGFDPFIIPASHPCPSNIDQLFEAPTSMVQSKDDQIVIIQKDGPVKQYKITDNRLFANRCLVGRGTVVLPVQAIDEGGISDEKQVVKISWPAKKRIREACLIRKLHQAIPEMAQHLPDITSFSDIDPEQLRLPRNCLNINVIEDFERNLHVVAMKRYKALWDVDSVEEFKNVFVDCVECHYAAHERGRVLHRDLSTNNLMSYWDWENDRRIGIVGDWDLASQVDDLNGVIPSGLKHRTGTIPFMSINLMSEAPPSHRYCHDLESFFYILVWASVHFKIREHRCEPTHPKFLNWSSLDLETALAFKKSFILGPSGYKKDVKEEFQELFETWIDALRIMFLEAYSSYTINDDTTTTFGRLEKMITFKSFMATIGRAPRYTYTQ